MSQMSRKRIKHPSEILEIGQEIEARIIKMDEKEHKISLSIREEEVDPWITIDDVITLNSEVTGTIESVNNFGAFVKISEGFVGLYQFLNQTIWTSYCKEQLRRRNQT